ncbi:MAG: T9SS type A sorting domain-containing protein [Elusimicrobiota bacterium]
MKTPLILALALWCAAAGAQASDLDAISVFPNPVRVSQGDERLIFANVVSPSKVRIYNAQGQLVQEMDLPGTDASSAFQWRLINEGRREVASGIYIYLLTNDKGDERVGKVAVIR